MTRTASEAVFVDGSWDRTGAAGTLVDSSQVTALHARLLARHPGLREAGLIESYACVAGLIKARVLKDWSAEDGPFLELVLAVPTSEVIAAGDRLAAALVEPEISTVLAPLGEYEVALFSLYAPLSGADAARSVPVGSIVPLRLSIGVRDPNCLAPAARRGHRPD